MDHSKKNYTPIQPYDITVGERHGMYDNLPYQCDNTLCNKESVQMESGNVVKYFQTELTDFKKIGGDSMLSDDVEPENSLISNEDDASEIDTSELDANGLDANEWLANESLANEGLTNESPENEWFVNNWHANNSHTNELDINISEQNYL